MHGLLLARVRDLGDGRQLELGGITDAAEVAVAHGVDSAITPYSAAVDCGLVDDLQLLVEVNPAAATGALVAQDLARHEVVGSLHTDADVALISAVRKVN